MLPTNFFWVVLIFFISFNFIYDLNNWWEIDEIEKIEHVFSIPSILILVLIS